MQGEGIELERVTSAEEMFEACERHLDTMDIAVFNAAVSDFTPKESFSSKVKRGSDNWSIQLKPTRDIAGELGMRKKSGQLFVGFALETDNEVKNAHSKMIKKNLDLIVLNSLREAGAGFGTDTNKVTMIDRKGNVENYELKPKDQVASDLVDRLVKMIEDA
jgi:phosphopantothenoylcysteine decarboxylase/phosphopantothenate--cysteine ligase